MMPAMLPFHRRAQVLLGALILCHAPLWAQGDSAKAITIPRVDRAPRLEDFLSRPQAGENQPGSTMSNGSPDGGPVGEAVRVTDFRQREPGDGDPVSLTTTAYLSYDDLNLYVVFVCTDEPGRVRANIARREDIGDDDQVMVYLDTFYDKKRAYLFAANPLGVQLDGLRTEGGDEDVSFDAVWESEGEITENGYVVRLEIPFRNLRFSQSPTQRWGIALGRKIQRNNEESYWPHITEEISSFVPQFGTAEGLSQISPGRNVQFNPYYTRARAREFDDDIPDHVTTGDVRTGLDAKMVVRDAFTIDATLNPDFSQVETDDPQVQINERFEVFFPEKRPFFLENAGYFQTPVNLFFSRRIVDPGVGLRTTGKLGGWAIGAVAMNDRQLDRLDEDDPLRGHDLWVGALRVQREIGEESSIGMLLTDQEVTESWQVNRIYSLDGRWRAGDNWEFIGQVIRNESRDHAGERFAGWGIKTDLGFETRNLEASASYEEYGPEFDALRLPDGSEMSLGFVNRQGFRQTDQAVQYTFRPDDSPIQQFGPELSVQHLWDHETGRLLDREVEGVFSVELPRSTDFEFSHKELFEHFEGFDFRPYENEIQGGTEWFKWLALDVSYAWGTVVNHDPAELVVLTPEGEEEEIELDPSLVRAREVEVELTLRPTSQLRFIQTFAQSQLRTLQGSSPVVTERLLRSKFNYQFDRRFSLRAIVDYELATADTLLFDEDARDVELKLDLLFTYLLNPGTALYVGYADEYENVRVGRLGDDREVLITRQPRTSTGRQFFIKVSYLWRL